MLDPKSLQVGSVVRLEGTIESITESRGFWDYTLSFKGKHEMDRVPMSVDAMAHAELVSTPVTFSKAQIAAIKEHCKQMHLLHFGETKEVAHALDLEWLEDHEDKGKGE